MLCWQNHKAKTDMYIIVANNFINAREALAVKIKRIISPNQRLIDLLCLCFGFCPLWNLMLCFFFASSFKWLCWSKSNWQGQYFSRYGWYSCSFFLCDIINLAARVNYTVYYVVIYNCQIWYYKTFTAQCMFINSHQENCDLLIYSKHTRIHSGNC